MLYEVIMDTFVFAAQLPLSRAAFERWLATPPSLDHGPDLERVFAGRWDAEAPTYEPDDSQTVLEFLKRKLLSAGPVITSYSIHYTKLYDRGNATHHCNHLMLKLP